MVIERGEGEKREGERVGEVLRERERVKDRKRRSRER